MITWLVVGAFVSLLVADDVRLRVRERRRRREDAAAVVAALGNTVLVDGMQLPKPDDERWATRTCTFKVQRIKLKGGIVEVDEDQTVLALGPVVIEEHHPVVHVNLRRLEVTAATNRYAQRCWNAYHSRTVRKAVES